MDALIRDLLALSRVDATVSSTATNTRAVAAAFEEDLSPSVYSVNGSLHVDVESADVPCSDTLLRQILWNIGENAVKYRRVNVPLEISIQGRRAGQSYEFRISDNGAGMSAEDAAHVFDPSFRASKVGSIPGTGLGLSIVKRVIEASGGNVSVTSEPGKGTTFLLALPLVS
jgi:signal transduction histidine kinase